ncbi:MAG: hypothetical protein ACRDJM_03225, partial [Actinomycetota bacterium]
IKPSDTKYPDTQIASDSYGGIWPSHSSAVNWISIGDTLTTNAVGSLAYTRANGGTIVAITGDGSFGGDSREGAGAFYTTDFGKRWVKAAGVPDDAFGFKVAVDQAHPSIVYVATGAGLYRSTNGGRSFVNVKLPTGECAGKSNRVKPCLLANMVTDVVVQAPGGTTDAPGGKVLAAVGWRGGNRANPDGTVQAPANGVYLSDTGAPGTFARAGTVGFPGQNRIGRTEMGAAYGPDQDHNYVYAMVQDAVLMRDGIPYIDAPAGDGAATMIPTVLNGIYVSPDFGETWVLMADWSALQHPATGSALAAVAQSGGTGPGVQAWYNEFIQPDPTRAQDGIPTRLVFGLEEVWQNELPVPLTGPTAFKVIGRYFSGQTCLFTTLLPVCPTDRDDALINNTTTHPDQHAVIFIPDDAGGVRLVVGNDGGVYAQSVAAGKDFTNANWGVGANRGFHTLLPYDAVRSADGTVWLGLQDNGTAKIVDIKRGGRVVERGRQIMTKGGDGFYVAVHPTNGNIAYGEYVGGTMASTSDGGKTWSEMSPPITSARFITQFQMDPKDPEHLVVAGNEIVETTSGPGTSTDDWKKVFDLGTHAHPGDAAATPSATDPVSQMSSINVSGSAIYAGFCAPCDVLNQAAPFRSGIATNVGGSKPPKRETSDGWHVAKAIGLPNRWVSSVAIHPQNPKIVYVSLGGYSRPWTPPGHLGAANSRIGTGHVYMSTDGGEHFRNISGNLPNLPVNYITLRGSEIIAATDVGVFISDPTFKSWEVLGKGLPMSPVYTVRLSHGDPNLLIAAAYGRGVYSYRFGPAPRTGATTVSTPAAPKFLGTSVAGPFGFETSDEGWTVTTNNALATWRRGQPGHTSSSSFQIVPYGDEMTAVLASPKFALPARSTVKLSWWERRDTELCCDFLTVDWSSDGRRWVPLRSIDGTNPDFPDFSQVSATFVAPKGSVYVRFRLDSDQLVSFPPYTGVAVDDVQIQR